MGLSLVKDNNPMQSSKINYLSLYLKKFPCLINV